MIFISAGHHNADPGASGCGKREADLTKIQRDLTCKELDKLGIKYVKDIDTETLGQYLKRITPTSKDVVIEFHFNAFNGKATGIETLVSDNPSPLSAKLAVDINTATVKVLGLANRGVKTEGQSHRGKLGLMREAGSVCLVELCFIDNCSDLASWEKNKEKLAVEYAKILAQHDSLA